MVVVDAWSCSDVDGNLRLFGVRSTDAPMSTDVDRNSRSLTRTARPSAGVELGALTCSLCTAS